MTTDTDIIGGEIDDLLKVESGLSAYEVGFLRVADAKRTVGRAFTWTERRIIHQIWDRFCGLTDEKASDKPDWRIHLLNSLHGPEIPNEILLALVKHEPQIITMGDLVDWQADKGDFWAKDINGIGKVAQDKIVDATAAYWARNKQAKEQAEEPAETETAAPQE